MPDYAMPVRPVALPFPSPPITMDNAPYRIRPEPECAMLCGRYPSTAPGETEGYPATAQDPPPWIRVGHTAHIRL